MINEIINALGAYTKSFQLISKHRLWGYALVPALISFLLAAGIFATAWGVSDNIGGLIMSWYPWEWGSNVVERIATITGGLLVGIIGLLIYKNLVIVLAGPFMSPLSEKVENILTGGAGTIQFSIPQMIKDLIRGLTLALRNIIREITFTILLLLIGIIPIFSPFTTASIFLVQSFYAGFGNFDFFLERHYKVRGSVQFMRNHRGAAIGNGAVFLLLIFTVIGVLVAPVLGTIAATIQGVELLQLDEYEEQPTNPLV